jgi:ATP-dependent helicase/nuclease subunit A
LGEELRILYVALTRAQDTLILAGTGTRHAPTHWAKKAESAPTTYQLLRSRSYLDWLGPWLTNQVGNPNWTAVAAGTTSLWSWQVDADLGTPSPPSVVPSTPETTPDPGALDQLEQRLLWSYPFSAATKEPAKTSVTALRHRSTIDEEATPAAFARPLPSISQSAGILDSAAIGTAQHRFMQLVNLDKVTSLAGLAEEVHRLGDEKIFTADELKALDPQAVLKFWHSDLGSRILAHRDSLQRELAFTVRITPRDLARLNLLPHSELAEDEFVLAQGTIDLAVLLPDRIWVVELKTDRITKDEVAERTRIYQPQLDLYAFALASIYQRPVTERWLYYFALGQGHSIPAIQQS